MEMGKGNFQPSEAYKDTVSALYDLFNFWNETYFRKELIPPVITTNYAHKSCMGWFTPWQAWKEINGENGSFEINVSPQYLNLPFEQTADTMLHEMVHQFCYVNNIIDTSRSGYYHNKKFKKVAEEHGLSVQKDKSCGWAFTELTERSKKLLKDFNLKGNILYNTSEKVTSNAKSGKTSSTRKYICPECGLRIRATMQVEVICAKCKKLFKEVCAEV